MMKYSFLFLIIIALHVQSIGQQSSTQSASDSLFIQIDKDQSPYLEASLTSGMTIYGLSKKFGVSVGDIQRSNPTLKLDDIPIGSEIMIPMKSASSSLISTAYIHDAKPVYYKVRAKENLYRISKGYFDVSVKDIKALNGLSNNNLDIDQVICVGFLKPVNKLMASTARMDMNLLETPAVQDQTIDTTSMTPDVIEITDMGELKIDSLEIDSVQEMRTPIDIYLEEGNSVYSQRGLAFWDKAQAKGKGLFVLHNRAKRRSIMEIVNPMNGQKVYAKVVGNIPSKSYTNDVKLVVSPAVAEVLNALDGRFYASFRFIE